MKNLRRYLLFVLIFVTGFRYGQAVERVRPLLAELLAKKRQQEEGAPHNEAKVEEQMPNMFEHQESDVAALIRMMSNFKVEETADPKPGWQPPTAPSWMDE